MYINKGHAENSVCPLPVPYNLSLKTYYLVLITYFTPALPHHDVAPSALMLFQSPYSALPRYTY